MAAPSASLPVEQSATSRAPKQDRKTFISSSSSFVDFVELKSEIYSDEINMTDQMYSPYKERNIKKPLTNKETIVHLLKGSVGAGMLAMPIAFSRIGVVTGIFGTLLLCALCIYGLTTLFRTQYIQCKRLRVPFLTLPRSMKVALLNGPKPFRKIAPYAPVFADLILVAYQLGVCVAYIIFMADTLKNIVESQTSGFTMDVRIYICIIFIPVVLINFIRDLKTLTVVSLIADILIVIALVIVFYNIFAVGPFHADEVVMVTPVSTWPLFVGTVLFAIDAVGVTITVEHHMEQPQYFLGLKGIFTWSMVFVSLIYMVVGLLGYVKYGQEVQQTIFENLPKNKWLSLVAQGVYGFCIFGSYALQCFVSLEILWGNYIRYYIDDPRKELVIEYALRISVVLITFIAALVVPYVDLVISLVGAVCTSSLGIIIPFILEFCTIWPNKFDRGRWIVFKDILFITIGVLILIIGAYVSIYSIISK